MQIATTRLQTIYICYYTGFRFLAADGNFAGVNDAANSLSAAANEVLTVTTELSRQSEKLCSELDNFLTKPRAS